MADYKKLLFVLALSVLNICAQTTSQTTTLKPNQGIGVNHCLKCGSESDPLTETERLRGTSISECFPPNGAASVTGSEDSLWECRCHPGFLGTYKGETGNGIKCFNNDECAAGTDNCVADADCVDTPGSFSCQCPDGFTDVTVGNLTECTDIDECDVASSCHENHGLGTCHNTHGSHYCICEEGYTNSTGNCLETKTPVPNLSAGRNTVAVVPLLVLVTVGVLDTDF